MKLKAGLCLLPLIVSSLGGCVSMRPTMTRFSLDYNRVVADTRNRMILLNIVRAAYREPTYYTALSQIEGSLNLQGSFNGEVANVTGGDPTNFTPTVAGSISNAPTFTVVPLTSEEFSKGMLKPIDPETIQLLLSQGWRTELLAPLVVQKVQCLYDGKVFHEIENVPRDYGHGVDFAMMTQIRLQDMPPDTTAAFQFSLAQEEAAALVTRGALDKFDIRQGADPHPGKTTLSISPKTGPALTAEIPAPLKDLCREKLGHPTSDTPAASLAPAQASQLSFAEKGVDRRTPKAPSPDLSATQLVFRSPDEIVYYLGDLLREDQKRGTVLTRTGQRVLFHISRNAAGADTIAVEHRGAKWSVGQSDPMSSNPNAEDDRTLQVIALLNDLIASQTSAEDFSRTPSIVRVR